MTIKIKKLHPNAVIPTYAKEGDAGMDLVAVSKEFDESGNVVYGTGLSFEIPSGYVGLIFPRSSNANKDLLLSNSVGVIDSGYRGEVTMKFKSTVTEVYEHVLVGRKTWGYIAGSQYQINDRIGQLIIIPYPKIEFEEVSELSESERGTGGYGSTGN